MKKNVRESIDDLKMYFKIWLIIITLAYIIGLIILLAIKLNLGFCVGYCIGGLMILFPIWLFSKLLISAFEQLGKDNSAEPDVFDITELDEDNFVPSDATIDPSMLSYLPKEDFTEDDKQNTNTSKQ